MTDLTPTVLLRASILNNLSDSIIKIKSYYSSLDIPGFIRIEGGIDRDLFIADMSPDISPEQRINFLPVPEDKKEILLDIYSHLLTPGLLLVAIDSDANLDDRITDWFIV